MALTAYGKGKWGPLPEQTTEDKPKRVMGVSFLALPLPSKLLLEVRKVALYEPYQLGLLHLIGKHNKVAEVFSFQ